MKDKLAEEILNKHTSDIKGLLDFGGYSCVAVPYENALKAMQAYHEAKLRTGDGMDHVCQSCKSKNQQPINQWQLCPKCAGQGRIWTPPNWPYNETYITGEQSFECDVCKGKKIISMITGLPPS